MSFTPIKRGPGCFWQRGGGGGGTNSFGVVLTHGSFCHAEGGCTKFPPV